MRSYNQFCGLAKALDVIGDRWSLLIVRELLVREACRYTDLRDGLPGIATNLLADRLREMEAAGLVEREVAPPPQPAGLFRLTARGRALEPALLALGGWGAPLLADAGKDDVLKPHWLVLPLRLHLKDARPYGPAAAMELRVGGDRIAVRAERGKVSVGLGAAADARLVLEGDPRALLALLLGRIGPDAARARGARLEGDLDLLERFAPAGPAD
jgi:DNA-binding HxlR family transcriptional regulator